VSADGVDLARTLGHLVNRSGLSATLQPGLSDLELPRIESEVGIRFPPDLAALLRVALPVSSGTGKSGFPDWRSDSPVHLRELVRRPFDDLVWAIEHGSGRVWPRVWGHRPQDSSEATVLALSKLASVSRLIPVYGHRYLPENPQEEGNPVFSVVGYDIVYYGSNLANYFDNEFGRSAKNELRLGPTKHIELWSDVADD